jgi:hypothetical protein
MTGPVRGDQAALAFEAGRFVAAPRGPERNTGKSSDTILTPLFDPLRDPPHDLGTTVAEVSQTVLSGYPMTTDPRWVHRPTNGCRQSVPTSRCTPHRLGVNSIRLRGLRRRIGRFCSFPLLVRYSR